MEDGGRVLRELHVAGHAEERGVVAVDGAVAVGGVVRADETEAEAAVAGDNVAVEVGTEETVVACAEAEREPVAALRAFGNDVDEVAGIGLAVKGVGPLHDLDAVDHLRRDEFASDDAVDERVAVAEAADGKGVVAVVNGQTARLGDGGIVVEGLLEVADEAVGEELGRDDVDRHRHLLERRVHRGTRDGIGRHVALVGARGDIEGIQENRLVGVRLGRGGSRGLSGGDEGGRDQGGEGVTRTRGRTEGFHGCGGCTDANGLRYSPYLMRAGRRQARVRLLKRLSCDGLAGSTAALANDPGFRTRGEAVSDSRA